MLKGSSKIAPEPSSDAAPSTSSAAAPSAAPAAAPAAATKSEQQRAKSKLLQRLDDMHREIEMLRDGAFGASWAEGFNAVAMHHAALSGDPNFVRDLLKDPLHKNCLERRDGAGWLPIHYAACVGLRRVFSLIARATPPPDGAYERVLDDLSKIVAHAAHARLQLGKSKKFPSVVAAEEGRWLRKEQQASEKLIAAELKKQRAAFGGGKKKGAMKYKA